MNTGAAFVRPRSLSRASSKMSRSHLTADLGNSALKLCGWSVGEGRLEPGGERAVPWGGDWVGELHRLLGELGTLEGIAACSVASRERTSIVYSALREASRVFHAEPDPRLRIECRDPHTIGRDRLYSARGAWEIVRAPVLVVDAGTALTVDAVDGDENEARFLGGAIAPGPALLASALAEGAANLFPVEPAPGAPALGRDSAEALRAGVSVGFVGSATLLVRRIAEEAGLETAPLLLTGGARAFLAAPGTFGAREVRVDPELVHRGLLAAAFGREP